jgi:hypothetical protein
MGSHTLGEIAPLGIAVWAKARPEKLKISKKTEIVLARVL